MKENELMIGNYLKYPNTEAFKLEQDDLTSKNFWCDFYEGIIKPVPLTEKWLLKFGFNMSQKFNYYMLFEFAKNFTCYYENGVISIEQFCEGDYPLKHIKYVHQLQNLCFALTQKQLEIKL